MSDKLKGLAPCVHEDGSGDYWIIEYPNGREAYAQRKAPPSASENQLNPLEETLVLLCEHWNSRPRPATLDAGSTTELLANELLPWVYAEMVDAELRTEQEMLEKFERKIQSLITAINSGNLGVGE